MLPSPPGPRAARAGPLPNGGGSLSAPPNASPWPGVALASVATLAAAFCLLGPVLGAPTELLLGTPDSEAADHAWRLAAALESTPHTGPWVVRETPGLPAPPAANVIPLTTLLAWPIYAARGGGLAAFCLAWNAQFALALLGAALGTWLFVREWLPDLDRRAIGAGCATAIVACSSMLQNTPEVGRLETLVQFFYPLHLYLLYRALVSRRGRLDLAAAAASFGIIALQGGHTSVFLAVFESFVGIWMLKQAPDRPLALRRLALVALAGLVGVAPNAVTLALHPPPMLAGQVSPDGSMAAGGQVSRAVIVPLAQLLPGGSSVPSMTGYHLKPYFGVLALALAFVAAGIERRAWAWLLAFLLTLACVLSVELRWMPDEPAWVPGPLSLARAHGWTVLTFVAWERMATYLPLCLGLAVAPLAARMSRGKPWMRRAAILAALLASVDQLAYLPAWGDKVTAWRAGPPEAIEARMAAGPVVHIPFGAHSFLWLNLGDHGQAFPMWEWENLPTLQHLAGVHQGCPRRFLGHARRQEPPGRDCVARDVGKLTERGYRSLALRRECAPETMFAANLAWLDEVLGPPSDQGPEWAVWTLAADADAAASCTIPLPPDPRPPPGHP